MFSNFNEVYKLLDIVKKQYNHHMRIVEENKIKAHSMYKWEINSWYYFYVKIAKVNHQITWLLLWEKVASLWLGLGFDSSLGLLDLKSSCGTCGYLSYNQIEIFLNLFS